MNFRANLTASTNLVLILGMMQVSKKVPWDDPTVLNGIRAVYVLSNLIILGLYMYARSGIKAKGGPFTRYLTCSLRILN